MQSRFGLYIKRDGDQRIEIANPTPGAISTLTALPLHPDYMTTDTETTSAIEYDVPMRDFETTDPLALVVPYRSTLKKFEAIWIGQPSGKIEGAVKLADLPRMIEGTLTNGTGFRLEDVYIAFKYPGDPPTGGDYLLWIKSWDAGVSIDLARQYYMNDKGERPAFPNHDKKVLPDEGSVDRLAGPLNLIWQEEFSITSCATPTASPAATERSPT